ncbi:unnamed protein product [Rhizophagus irregularis]|nr:unnamed protein product [Rhizophagus irregularis]
MIYLHGYFYILTGENPDGSDQSLRFLGQLLSFYSVHPTCNTIRGSRIGYMGFEGPRRDWIPISKVQDAHLETLTLTSGLRIWIQNFFFVALIQLLILFLLELGFSLGATNLEQLDLFF